MHSRWGLKITLACNKVFNNVANTFSKKTTGISRTLCRTRRDFASGRTKGFWNAQASITAVVRLAHSGLVAASWPFRPHPSARTEPEGTGGIEEVCLIDQPGYPGTMILEKWEDASAH